CAEARSLACGGRRPGGYSHDDGGEGTRTEERKQTGGATPRLEQAVLQTSGELPTVKKTARGESPRLGGEQGSGAKVEGGIERRRGRRRRSLGNILQRPAGMSAAWRRRCSFLSREPRGHVPPPPPPHQPPSDSRPPTAPPCGAAGPAASRGSCCANPPRCAPPGRTAPRRGTASARG
ncbi:unnamed protein product, partial [Prorocentrum cordatum]